MKFNRYAALPVFGIALVSAPAFAASDVSNSPATANQAVAAAAAPIVATQSSSLIGGAIGNALGGGFSGGGMGGGAGFAPSGAGGAAGPQSFNSRQMGKAGAAGQPKLGVWAQGTYVDIDKKEAFMELDGSVYTVMGGVDYKFNDRGVVGVAVGYDHTDITTKFNNGTYEGDGLTVAPYVGYAVTPNWSVDASVGHSWVSYDVSRNNNAAMGSFDAERWFASANVTGAYAYDRWRMSPKVGVMYMKEDQDDYRETGAAASAGLVKGSTITLGRASAGLKAGYAFDHFMPYGKITGEWDFNSPNAVRKANGQMSSVDDGGLVLGLGVDIFSGPVSGTIEASYDSALRQDLDVWKGTARIRYEF